MVAGFCPGEQCARNGMPVTEIPLDPRHLAERVGEWLRPDGPEGDVVVSCRVRLARNLAAHPFMARLGPEEAHVVGEVMREVLVDTCIDGETLWVDMASSSPVLRELLRERHLISRDMCPENQAPLPGRGLAFGRTETLSVMVNEEDHLRLQAMAAGFQPESAWEQVRDLDLHLEQCVEYACDDRLGYLTSCPTNVGTGLRASVMLHLPALGMVRRELEKVFNAAQRTGLAVRGMQGEGSRAVGDLYQISNQVTLGRSESQLLGELSGLVPEIIAFERQMRTLLLAEHRSGLSDRVHRSLGLLQSSRAMPTDGALAHLSNLRLGLHLGLIDAPSMGTLGELWIQVQKGHIHALCAQDGSEGLLDVSQRDKLRAGLLRSRLAQ